MTLFLLVLALLGIVTSGSFLLLVLVAAVRYRSQRSQNRIAGFCPPLSVLKPVHGLEPDLERNIESFFRQDYPAYELLFCARHDDDPALQLARKIAARYPDVPCRILTSGDPPWSNAKVFSLHHLAPAAEHDLLVISDSDVSVEPNYLREIVQPFADEKVGVATCLYRGVPAGGLWSRLEALGMSVEMTSGVLTADLLEGMKFALGPTMVTRKQCIAAIGGFERMAEYCADDFLLGNWAEEFGYKVALLHHTVNHHVVNRSMRDSLRHQVRWMRSTRFSRPKGHFGTVLTFAMPFGVLGALAGVAAGRPMLGYAILAAAVLSRMLQSAVVGYGVVGDRLALRDCWLYPVRDLLGFFLWCGSYAGSTIDWRGEAYRLELGGRMVRTGVVPAAVTEDSAA